MAGYAPPCPAAAGYQPASGGPIAGAQGAVYYPAMGPPTSSSTPYPPVSAQGNSCAYPPQPQSYPYGYPAQQQAAQQAVDPMAPPIKPIAPPQYTTSASAGGQEYAVTGFISSVHPTSTQQLVTVQPMAVQAVPYSVSPPPTSAQTFYTVHGVPWHGDAGCCTAGWLLFGVGFLFPVCWLVAIFLPYCSKHPSDKRAAIASGIVLAICSIVTVLAVAIPLSIVAREAAKPCGYDSYGHYICSSGNSFHGSYGYNG